MAQYMLVSRNPNIDLVNATSIANGPTVSHSTRSTGPTASSIGPSGTVEAMNSANDGGSSGNRPAAPVDHLSGLSLSALNLAGAGPATAAVGRPPAVTVVQERETPVTPGIDDPVLFHNSVQAALAAVLKHSAGQDCPQGVMRSCNHASAEGSADTVTVRLCPNKSKHPLVVTNVRLKSCIVYKPFAREVVVCPPKC